MNLSPARAMMAGTTEGDTMDGSMDRLTLDDWWSRPLPCCDHHAGWADAPPCEWEDEPDPDDPDPDEDDPDATAGVDPATGQPLEHTGVNVRLTP